MDTKLLKLEVDPGDTKRAAVAGIASYYTPEQLASETVILEVNSKPARYNTPQKLDNPLRWMLACHTKKEARYGPNDTQEPQRSF